MIHLITGFTVLGILIGGSVTIWGAQNNEIKRVRQGFLLSLCILVVGLLALVLNFIFE